MLFVQSWVKITQARSVSAKFELRCKKLLLPTSWCLDALKNNWENYAKKCFFNKRKRNRVKRWSAFEQLRAVEHLLRQYNKKGRRQSKHAATCTLTRPEWPFGLVSRMQGSSNRWLLATKPIEFVSLTSYDVISIRNRATRQRLTFLNFVTDAF